MLGLELEPGRDVNVGHCTHLELLALLRCIELPPVEPHLAVNRTAPLAPLQAVLHWCGEFPRADHRGVDQPVATRAVEGAENSGGMVAAPGHGQNRPDRVDELLASPAPIDRCTCAQARVAAATCQQPGVEVSTEDRLPGAVWCEELGVVGVEVRPRLQVQALCRDGLQGDDRQPAELHQEWSHSEICCGSAGFTAQEIGSAA